MAIKYTVTTSRCPHCNYVLKYEGFPIWRMLLVICTAFTALLWYLAISILNSIFNYESIKMGCPYIICPKCHKPVITNEAFEWSEFGQLRKKDWAFRNFMRVCYAFGGLALLSLLIVIGGLISGKESDKTPTIIFAIILAICLFIVVFIYYKRKKLLEDDFITVSESDYELIKESWQRLREIDPNIEETEIIKISETGEIIKPQPRKDKISKIEPEILDESNEKFNEYKETTSKTSIKLPLFEKDIYSYAVTYLDVDLFDNFNYENQVYFREAVDIVSESMLSEYDNEADIRIQKEDAINIIRQILSGVIKIPYLIENEIIKMFSRSIRVDDKGCCGIAQLRPILTKVIERYINKHKNDEPSIRLNTSTKREPKIDPNYTMSDDIKDQLHRKFFWYRFDNLARLINIKINGYDCKLYIFYEPKESTFSEFALKYFIEVDNDICPQYFFVTYKENLDFVKYGEDAPYFENRTFYIESVKLEKERPLTNELGILARSHQKKQLYQRFIAYLEKVIK